MGGSNIRWEGVPPGLGELGPKAQRGCMQVTLGKGNMGGSWPGDTGPPLLFLREVGTGNDNKNTRSSVVSLTSRLPGGCVCEPA